jgi:prepilin-type N-terminal cleavage/methylation domain-containing protein
MCAAVGETMPCRNKHPFRAFTLVELLVVIGIIALLISILLPALSKARNQATLTVCSAQLRDFGNAVQLYAQDNHGSFPGPCWDQMRAGYFQNSFGLPEYIHKYLRLPDPSTVNGKPGYDANTPIIMKSLLCPGYAANHQGVSALGREWTYGCGGFDPYPWFGYPDNFATQPSAFPIRVSLTGFCLINGKKMTPPMKLAQMFSASQMPIIFEQDQADVIYVGGAPPFDMAGGPSHGGKNETRQGAVELTVPLGQYSNPCSPYYQITDKSAATNPPRNVLYGDWHVATHRKSGPVLPHDLRKFGTPPTGVNLLTNE